MRKILLATTALIGFATAGAAHAASAPLNVTVGGNIDFVAGAFHESKAVSATNSSSSDFETLYKLTFGVAGKAANGINYGANIVLDNYPAVENNFDGTSNAIAISAANVFLSGAYGKLQLGDSRGATDLTVTAPTVGEGQVLGRYIDFLDRTMFAKAFSIGIDAYDHDTNITYYSPKIGTAAHKIQGAVTYIPNINNYGSSVALAKTTTYSNGIKSTLLYTGGFKPVTADVSLHFLRAGTDATPATRRPFSSWGIGSQIGYKDFTFGGHYTDFGHFGTVGTRNKDQYLYALGLTYKFDKFQVGASYLTGQGYSDIQGVSGNYVKDFNDYGIGGSYAWTPGLTSNVDVVLFQQKLDSGLKNDGYVLLFSQKLTF
jgi:outer membrane protein OmpU